MTTGNDDTRAASTDRREGRHASREADGAVAAIARIVARNSTGQRQSYPFVPTD